MVSATKDHSKMPHLEPINAKEEARRCRSHLNLALTPEQHQRSKCIYASLPHHYKAPQVTPSYDSSPESSASSASPGTSTCSSTVASRSNSSSSSKDGYYYEEEDGNRNHEDGSLSHSVKANLMKLWFQEFSDVQRNAFLRDVLEICGTPQIHTLSVLLENQLHKDCPPNCKDFLEMVPAHVSQIILGYLDPTSLARASQVSHLWHEVTNDNALWKELCLAKNWKLQQTPGVKDEPGAWKQLFAFRWRVLQNWMTGRCHIRTFEGHTHAVTCVQMDDTRIVSGSHDKTIKVWDVRTNSPWSVMTLVGHSGTVRCIQLLGGEGSNPRLVSGSSDRTIKVWDLSIQQQWSAIACRTTMVGHLDTVRCLQADEEKVISGSYDSTLKVWCIKTGRCLRTLTGHEGRVLTIFLDKKDGTLISGSDDCRIKVWRLASGSCMDTLQGHTEAVTCLTLTSDGSSGGRKIISGSLDRTIKVWCLETRQCLSTLDWMNSEGHTRVIRCLQADSWRIISAADDKTLKMWSLDTGQRLVTFRKHEDGVTCVQFNDFMMVSGSYDKTVKLWDFRVC